MSQYYEKKSTIFPLPLEIRFDEKLKICFRIKMDNLIHLFAKKKMCKSVKIHPTLKKKYQKGLNKLNLMNIIQVFWLICIA